MIDSTLKNAHILIVDDQQANIDVLKDLLELQQYYNVYSITDPRELTLAVAENTPDIILLDLNMPFMSGYKVMEQLTNLVPSTEYLPVLVLTSDITTEARQKALSGGASDFITKPFDLIEVGLRIRNLLYTRFLHQQLWKQNKNLEKEVHKRTSELEQTNNELIMAKDKAEASDRLKTTFINNISHEIRTPLNGILGIGQVLHSSKLTPEKREFYMGLMNDSSERLINTITNFLDISLIASKNLTINLKTQKLEPVITSIIERFEKQFVKKRITCTATSKTINQHTLIYTDIDLIGKILFHLVDNAIKFTQSGKIDVKYEIEGSSLILIVEDTGVGISEEHQKRIFNIFTQEDETNTRTFGGNGLGLAIANGMIELLKGEVRLKSSRGVGSTFTITIPGIFNQLNLTSNGGKPLKKSEYSILIAEDDDVTYTFLSFMLEKELVKIYHAQNGGEAIRICQNHPNLDIVLMDIKMPDIDGIEATRQIKLIRNSLPVIITTAYTNNEVRENAMAAGCDNFIIKPYNEDMLRDVLTQYIDL